MSEWVKRKPKIKYREYDDMFDKLLKIRGIKDKKQLMQPDKSVLHNPYKLNNIRLVAERIVKAIKHRELISISADVDV